MIDTYQIKGAVRDLGKALGLPLDEIDQLAKSVEPFGGGDVRKEMLALPEFRDKVAAPGWRDLIDWPPRSTASPATWPSTPAA